MAANGRRGRPQGKCHRKQTAGAGQPQPVRVKGCGKSAPRLRQRRRHGKPHREQDRIGAARARRQLLRPGAIQAAARVGCWRLGAIPVPDEWPSRRAFLQTEPGLQASWQLPLNPCRDGAPKGLAVRSRGSGPLPGTASASSRSRARGRRRCLARNRAAASIILTERIGIKQTRLL